MESITLFTYTFFSILANLPKIILLAISIGFCIFRKFDKSSKFFLLTGLIVFFISWIPTIIANYSLKELIDNYNFGYASYFASLYSGEILAFILLLIGLIISFKTIGKNTKIIWIISIFLLISGYTFAVIGILTPNTWILISFLLLNWFLEIMSCIFLLRTVLYGERIK